MPMNDYSRWFVARTRSRLELVVRDGLLAAGVEAYAPQWRVEFRHRRSKAWVTQTRTLFLGYLFVRVDDPRQWRTILTAKHVLGPVGTRNADGGIDPSPVPAGVVEDLMAAEAGMLFDDTREARRLRGEHRSVKDMFPAGASVTLLDGPLAQLVGTVDAVNGKGLVQVLVDLFGRATTVEARPENLRAA